MCKTCRYIERSLFTLNFQINLQSRSYVTVADKDDAEQTPILELVARLESACVCEAQECVEANKVNYGHRNACTNPRIERLLAFDVCHNNKDRDQFSNDESQLEEKQQRARSLKVVFVTDFVELRCWSLVFCQWTLSLQVGALVGGTFDIELVVLAPYGLRGFFVIEIYLNIIYLHVFVGSILA